MPKSKPPERLHGIFIPKTEEVVESGNLLYITGKRPVAGDVGLEIEVEGSHLLHEDDVPDPWGYHVDNSLRGPENAEYVLRKPIKFKDVPKALDTLWAAFCKKKSVLQDSNRTSVHVHLNCQQFHMNRLAAFLGLIFSLEEPLTEWCGEHRVGNLFCLRGIDAPGIITAFQRFIKYDANTNIGEYLRYAAVNPHSLIRFGSLEIRTLRGCSDPKIIEEWVSILERLHTLSADFPDPREVCTTLSSLGPLAFFDRMLGDKAQVIRQGINWTDDQLREAIYRGVRLAQDICYCREWELYKPVNKKPDPFGRNKKGRVSTASSGSQFSSALNAYINTVAQSYNTQTLVASAPTSDLQWALNTIEEQDEPDNEPEPEYDDDEEDEDF